MENLKFIVTGTGRCGTVYLAKFLTSIGVPCCHEGIFDFEKKETIIKRIEDPSLRVLSRCSMLPFLGGGKKIEKWVDSKKTVADSSYLAVP